MHQNPKRGEFTAVNLILSVCVHICVFVCIHTCILIYVYKTIILWYFLMEVFSLVCFVCFSATVSQN